MLCESRAEASTVGLIRRLINDMLLSSMLYEFSENISSDTVLFDDHVATGS
jgi:hypothetical protein